MGLHHLLVFPLLTFHFRSLRNWFNSMAVRGLSHSLAELFQQAFKPISSQIVDTIERQRVRGNLITGSGQEVGILVSQRNSETRPLSDFILSMVRSAQCGLREAEVGGLGRGEKTSRQMVTGSQNNLTNWFLLTPCSFTSRSPGLRSPLWFKSCVKTWSRKKTESFKVRVCFFPRLECSGPTLLFHFNLSEVTDNVLFIFVFLALCHDTQQLGSK